MKVALFAHYQRPNTPTSENIFTYLIQLIKFSDIVYCLVNLPENTLVSKELEEFCVENRIKLITYDNAGYDFGAYQRCLLSDEDFFLTCEELILANDSCTVVTDMGDTIEQLRSNLGDKFLWGGITASTEVWYHVQSYFLMFNGKMIPMLMSFFKKNGVKNTLNEVIMTYEVGLSRVFAQTHPFYTIFKPRTNKNPTIWDVEYLMKNGVPLLKNKILDYTLLSPQEYIFLKSQNYNFKNYREIYSL